MSRAAVLETRHAQGGNAWQGARDLARATGSLRIPELIFGFGLFVEFAVPGVPMPWSQLAMIGAIALGLARRTRSEVAFPGWAFGLLAVGLFYVALISMFTPATEYASSWQTRLIRMGLTVLFLAVAASGRLDIRSLLMGLLSACVVNVPLHYLGITPDTYGGVLTGLAADKNVAGLTYAVVGVLVVMLTERRSYQFLIVIGFSAALWGTGSRTSIAAYGAAVVWILVAPRIPQIGRWVLGVGLFYVVGLLEEDYSQIGVFSDREGSDLLRARIDDASQIKVGEALPWGAGLGEAYVWIEDNDWFFHNSYWSAMVEGGWPWLIIVLLVTVVVGLRPFTAGRLTRPELIAQAATIALLISSSKLGEVLFTTQWALVLAVAVRARALAQADDVQERRVAAAEWERTDE